MSADSRLWRGLALAASFVVLAGCGSSDFPADPAGKVDGQTEVQGWYEKIENAVATGTPVTLPTIKHNSVRGADDLGEAEDLSLVLKRSDAIAPDAFFEINGLPAPWPFIRVYEGHVEGAPEEIAHIMVAEDFIRGAIRIADRMNLVRINMRRNRPAEMTRGTKDVEAQPVDRPPRSPEPSACPDDPYLNLGEARPIPPYANPEYTFGLADGPVLKSRVILDADHKAAEVWGVEHLAAMMIGMTIEMDLTYRNQVGIRHQIVGVHQNRINSYYPNTIDTHPFAEMAQWWDNHHAGERDIVHLFSGWDTGYAQANCIGGTGTPAGYSFSPIAWEDQYTWFHQNAFAHEFGHLYSAHHHYGNHVESDLATIMIMGYTPGAQPKFGTIERLVIRGWAEEYLKPWQ